LVKNKYKTTKNSPNKVYKKENIKSLKYFNAKRMANNNFLTNEKKSKIFKSKNIINNKTNYKKSINNKILFMNKKPKENVLIDEILKNKLTNKIKKKTITTKNSNNNSINLSNNTYKNMQTSDIVIPRLTFNNHNNGNKFLKIREQIVYSEDNKEKIDNDNIFNFSNYLNNSSLVKNLNSYRPKDNMKKISIKTNKNIFDKKHNYYGQTSKDFYIIKKYISSVLSNQPQRHQNPNFSKTKKYNTITNRKIINFPLSNRKTNTNNDNNKIEVNNNIIKSKIRNEKDSKILVKYNIHGKNKNKTTNKTKFNSRKNSIDKNLK
jgi:hypothetical protein